MCAVLKSLPPWMIVAIIWGVCLITLFSIKLVVMRSLSFTILDKAKIIEEPTGISFKIRLKILKKFDEVIDTVCASVEQQALDLLEWEGQPLKGVRSNRNVIFGRAKSGIYNGKTLIVIMKHNGRTVKHSCLIV